MIDIVSNTFVVYSSQILENPVNNSICVYKLVSNKLP